MAGYRFTGKLDNNAPRQDEYTFYIAAMDNSGNYSEVNEVTVQHPGIAQLPQPEVQRFFEAFVIEMPEVLTKFSKNQVYPDNSLTEEKDILGYVIRLDRVDTPKPGEESFIEKKVPAGKSSEMIEVPAKSQWELTIGAYDSVYHPDYNSNLFESTFSNPLALSARQIDDIVDFVDELRPVEIVDSLPTLPDTNYPEGVRVFNWNDRKLYKNTADSWVPVVNTDDLVGQITETQITDDSISTPKLQANAVTANEILAGTITANEIATNTITAGQIQAGAISTDELAANAITADKISSGEIYGYHVQADEIDTIHLKANSVEADKINVNDLSAINATFSGELTAPDTKIYSGTYGGILEFYNNGDKIVEIGNGKAETVTGSQNTGIFKLYTDNIYSKVGGFIGTNNSGFLLVGHENTASSSISTTTHSYIHGGSGTRGGSIRLKDDQLDDGLVFIANRDGKRIYSSSLTGTGGSFTLDSNVGGNSYLSVDNINANSIEASTKNFSIKHPNPNKNEYKLIHSAVETPTEGDNIYRYSIEFNNDNSKKEIELPSYFKYLNKNTQVFVSPKDNFGSGYGEIQGNKVIIKNNRRGKYNILIIGTRKDKDAINNWNGAEVKFEETSDYALAYSINDT